MSWLWVVQSFSPHRRRDWPLYIKIAHEETYGEPFDIPATGPAGLHRLATRAARCSAPAAAIFRGNGRIFYFQPGHEEFPIYYQPEILQVIRNAIHWAAPIRRVDALECPHVKKPLEND